MKSRRLMGLVRRAEGHTLAHRRMRGVVRRSKIRQPMSELGQKPALPRRNIGVRFALNKQTLTKRV